MKNYRRVSIGYVEVDNRDLESSPEYVGDAHGIDEQIRYLIDDIMDAQRDKQYTKFRIVLQGKRGES